MFFLSGLPRSGSTLLQTILNQNSNLYVTANSPLCQLMWDVKQSCDFNAAEQLSANNRKEFKEELLKTIPKLYYKNINKTVIDKCRTWTLEENIKLIKNYINPDPKIIVLVRPIEEVLTSFKHIFFGTKHEGREVKFLTPNSEPIMRPYLGLVTALNNKEHKEFLHIISYKELVNNPKETVNKLYSFLSIPAYSHSFTGLKQKVIEDDTVYGVPNMHYVRSEINLDSKPVDLPSDILHTCNLLNNELKSMGVQI